MLSKFKESGEIFCLLFEKGPFVYLRERSKTWGEFRKENISRENISGKFQEQVVFSHRRPAL